MGCSHDKVYMNCMKAYQELYLHSKEHKAFERGFHHWHASLRKEYNDYLKAARWAEARWVEQELKRQKAEETNAREMQMVDTIRWLRDIGYSNKTAFALAIGGVTLNRRLKELSK